VLNQLRVTLRRLRETLSGKAEQAYRDRDAANLSTKDSAKQDSAYAAGEGHAYGVAEEEIREAEQEDK
jgi:hypothetical protein